MINNFKTFEWEDLKGKILEMHVATDLSNGTDFTCKTTYGIDVKTGNKYVVNQEIIKGE